MEAWYGDVYDVPAELGSFDVVLVGSVLEHLSDPIMALASITRRADDTLVIVTPMLDRDDAIAEFAGRADNPGADYTWWVSSRGVYREVLAMLGFAIAKETRNSYEWSHGGREEERTTLVAVRRGAPPA